LLDLGKKPSFRLFYKLFGFRFTYPVSPDCKGRFVRNGTILALP
jgi:hypothetical protein